MIDKQKIDARAKQLNTMAAQGVPLEDNADLPDTLYYKSLCLLYGEYRRHIISVEEARKQKQKLTKDYIDNKYAIDKYHDSVKAAIELDKLIAPESELKDLTRQEALEKLLRFQAVLNGTLEKYDGDMPQMYSRLMDDFKEDNNDNDGNQGQSEVRSAR